MDLYSISKSLWRHKFVTLPLLLLTFVGCLGVVFVKAPSYTTSSTYILSPPPTSANTTQGAGNPFLNYGGLPIVGQELTTVLSTPGAEAKLESEGATGSYSMAPSQLFGNSTPLIQINVMATSPVAALTTANLVGKALVSKMNEMQAVQGVAPSDRIKTLLVTAPSPPVITVSSKLRDLIAVFAVGIMLIFVSVSILNAFDERALRRRQASTDTAVGVSGPEPVSGHSGPEQFGPEQPGTWQLPNDSPVSEAVGGAEADVAFLPTESSSKLLRVRNERRFSS